MSEAMHKAVAACGGVTELARRIGAKQPRVSNWLCRGSVPAEMALPICRATAGAVTPHDLRPDLYPDPDWLPADVLDTNTSSVAEASPGVGEPAPGEGVEKEAA